MLWCLHPLIRYFWHFMVIEACYIHFEALPILHWCGFLKPLNESIIYLFFHFLIIFHAFAPSHDEMNWKRLFIITTILAIIETVINCFEHLKLSIIKSSWWSIDNINDQHDMAIVCIWFDISLPLISFINGQGRSVKHLDIFVLNEGFDITLTSCFGVYVFPHPWK